MKTIRLQRRSARGLSLVEVLVSVVMLAVILIGLAPALTATVLVRRQSDSIAQASALAQQQMEAIREAWQRNNYHVGANDYTANTLQGLNGTTLPTIATVYNFAANQTIDRPYRWYPADSTLPQGGESTGQFADMAPTDGTGALIQGSVAVPGSQFVVRTTVTVDGPQSFCTGAVGTTNTQLPCLDPDGNQGQVAGGGARMFSSLPDNAQATGVLTCAATDAACNRPPVDTTSGVRLFKSVTVTVFRADANGNPIGDGAPPPDEVQQPLRTSNYDENNPNNLFARRPLAVLTTNF
jgi:Tfp pilus assembly protein PilV